MFGSFISGLFQAYNTSRHLEAVERDRQMRDEYDRRRETAFEDNRRADRAQRWERPRSDESGVEIIRACRRVRYPGDPENDFYQVDIWLPDGSDYHARGDTLGDALIELGECVKARKVEL